MLKKWVWVIVIIASLGICTWFAILNLAWRIPPFPETRAIELADLDGDGDLDAFLANGRNEGAEPNTVLFNDGNGRFRDSGQQLGEAGSEAVILRDFDDDGDIDALVSNSWGSYLDYFWNDGHGQFPQSQYVPMPTRIAGYFVGVWRFAAADLNEDARLDLFLVGCCGGGRTTDQGDWQTLNAHNSVWLSDEDGLPQNSDQVLGVGSSTAVALADLDRDGDQDAFVANSIYIDEAGDPATDTNRVWLNDGQGVFTNSEQQLGSQRSYAIAVGDLDGDGDGDALVGNHGPDEIWWNDGQGQFSISEQIFGDDLTRYVFLADLDLDGDVDAFLGGDKQGRIWFNDGVGYFSQGNQRLTYSNRHAVTLGDVNDDGAVDVVVGKLDDVVVWLNDGAGQMRKLP
jgi:hypothetical protein